MTVPKVVDRDEAWDGIARIDSKIIGHTAQDLVGLPLPARRLLEQTVPLGEVPIAAVVLDMDGEIKLKRWLPFTARQILHPTGGFVWNATVGPWWLRFRGGDSCWRGQGSLEFRLAGRIPVVRATGADIDRSAAGRWAAEVVAWTPQALLPAAGASWRPIDDSTATVSRDVEGDTYEVTVTIDDSGGLRDLRSMRWGNPDGGEAGWHPFGGSVSQISSFNGVSIAAAGTVGWWWGTDRQPEGEFFRYRILDAHTVGELDD
jgi:hypothetical protein